MPSEELEYEPVALIMTRNVITIDPDQRVAKARALFDKHKIKHLPVESEGKLVGIISTSDLPRLNICKLLYDSKPSQLKLDELKVSDLMQASAVSVSPGDNIREVANLMLKADFHALPVEDNGRIAGIVTSSDIISRFLEIYDPNKQSNRLKNE